MSQLLRHPDAKLFFTVFALMLLGAIFGNLLPNSLYVLAYLFIVLMQVMGYGLGITRTAVSSGSASVAVRSFAQVSKIAIPLYAVVIALFVLDYQNGWHLVTNPISAILFYLSLGFLVARTGQRAQASGLLRGANPTSQDGVAAQRRPVAPETPATRPSTTQPAREASSTPKKPSKADKARRTASSSAIDDPFADAVRPDDEDE